MVTRNTIMLGVERLTWRGMSAPVSDVSYKVVNTHAGKEYIYMDVPAHESTGRGPVEISCRFHFINTLDDNVILYPDEWNNWYPTLVDGQPGRLVHPDLGEMFAIVRDVDVQLNAENLGGINVSVTFIETRVDTIDIQSRTNLIIPFDPVVESIAAADADARLQSEAYADSVNFGPLRKLEAPVRDVYADKVTISELLTTPGRIVRQMRSASRFGSTAVLGVLNQTLGSINEVIDAFDGNVADTMIGPSRWVLRNQLITLYYAVKAAAEKAQVESGSRPIATYVTSGLEFIPTIAERLGNKVTDIGKLNPQYLQRPFIENGSKVKYYK